MSKILCISRGMLFQGALYAPALGQYFDEVHFYGDLVKASYEVEVGIKEFNDNCVVGREEVGENLESYDCILGMDHGRAIDMFQIKRSAPNIGAVFGLQILDYPEHVFNQHTKDHQTNASLLWEKIKPSLKCLDFVVHNQEIALNSLSSFHPQAISEFVRWPVYPMGEDLGKQGDYILYSGRLSPDKGMHYILSALAIIDADIPLYVVGGGYDYSKIAEHLGVKYIHVKNCSEKDKWQLYRECRFTVCGADNPYIPALSVLEGIAVGKSSIVFDYPENHLHYKEFVWYCRPRDIDSMARCIKYMWNNPKLSNDRASKGPEWVKKEATYDVWAKKVFSMYEKARDKK